jgi:hypothetical protein
MHGLRHAPGSNHVKVSFLGVFTFSFVIGKYNLQSSDGTSQFCPTFSLLSRPFSVILFLSYCPVSTTIVPFHSRGLYPHPQNLSAKVIIILQTSANNANYY